MGRDRFEGDGYGGQFHRPLHHRPVLDVIEKGLTAPSSSLGPQDISALVLPEALKSLGPDEMQGLVAYHQTGGAAPVGDVESRLV